jgi:hypothetical protein
MPASHSSKIEPSVTAAVAVVVRCCCITPTHTTSTTTAATATDSLPEQNAPVLCSCCAVSLLAKSPFLSRMCYCCSLALPRDTCRSLATFCVCYDDSALVCAHAALPQKYMYRKTHFAAPSNPHVHVFCPRPCLLFRTQDRDPLSHKLSHSH